MRILETSKGSGVRFTCDSLETLNREYMKLSSHYEAIQSTFIDTVVEVCCELYFHQPKSCFISLKKLMECCLPQRTFQI